MEDKKMKSYNSLLKVAVFFGIVTLFSVACFATGHKNFNNGTMLFTDEDSMAYTQVENTALIYVRGIIVEVTNHQTWMEGVEAKSEKARKSIYYIQK
jgi:hypothetical protein